MKTFREYLAEAATNDKFHYCSILELYNILKNGFIEGGEYIFNGKNFPYSYNQQSPNAPKEFCLARKASEKRINKISPQPIGNIKIIFDWDNMRNLRNVKKPYPISEFRTRNVNFIKQWIEKLNTSEENKKKLFDWAVKLNQTKIRSSREKNMTNLFNNILDIKSQKEFKEIEDAVMTILGQEDTPADVYRENEERIDLTKGKIPVSSKYIKILLGKNLERKGLKEIINDFDKDKITLEKRYKGKIPEEKYNEYLDSINLKIKKTIEAFNNINSLINQYKKKDPELFGELK